MENLSLDNIGNVIEFSIFLWETIWNQPKNNYFVTLALGTFTQIFSGITSLIALIPFFGPFILKVISIPIFYILNAMGWVVSAVAIKKGYVNELSKSRTITLALLVGIIIGYILGNIIPLNK